MAEAAARTAISRLMIWLSPVFPVGGFAYSQGLERAVHDGLVADAADLSDWLLDQMTIGSAWNDAVLFSAAWRGAGKPAELAVLAELGEALAGSAERHLETTLQGSAFRTAACQGWASPSLEGLSDATPYGVAVGAAAGDAGLPLHESLIAFLQAFVSNQLQAAIRLSVCGQQGAVGILASLESVIEETAARAFRSTLDDLGSATLLAEIAAMNHEIQPTRLFRS